MLTQWFVSQSIRCCVVVGASILSRLHSKIACERWSNLCCWLSYHSNQCQNSPRNHLLCERLKIKWSGASLGQHASRLIGLLPLHYILRGRKKWRKIQVHISLVSVALRQNVKNWNPFVSIFILMIYEVFLFDTEISFWNFKPFQIVIFRTDVHQMSKKIKVLRWCSESLTWEW